MIAAQKMRDYGLKALAADACVDLATAYRWVAKIESGRGVSDQVKRKVMTATAGSSHAVAFVDFNIRVTQ